jgi:two-component system, OmpR family, phosphate regulon response regulator PhoB
VRGKKTILVVDDQDVVRRLLQATLARKQFEVLQAHDGAEALRLVGEHHPDLVLLDVMMPGADGFQVCQRIKLDPLNAGTRVLILSSLGRIEDVTLGRAAGADDYVIKPFSPLALLRKIDSLLDGTGHGDN